MCVHTVLTFVCTRPCIPSTSSTHVHSTIKYTCMRSEHIRITCKLVCIGNMKTKTEKLEKILVECKGNASKHYDGRRELVLLANIVAIKEVAVIYPSIDQLSAGDSIECKHIFTKGQVEVWCGVVVALSPEMERRPRQPTPNSVISSPGVDESSHLDCSASARSKHEHPCRPLPAGVSSISATPGPSQQQQWRRQKKAPPSQKTKKP